MSARHLWQSTQWMSSHASATAAAGPGPDTPPGGGINVDVGATGTIRDGLDVLPTAANQATERPRTNLNHSLGTSNMDSRTAGLATSSCRCGSN